ncbi:hypothetical protein LNQ52_23835 [Klebsiella pneumoniae subsp. pneumoniae]|nr:hypothetical protein [Klebsiella pneumoniae subsp. pneumoniae]
MIVMVETSLFCGSPVYRAALTGSVSRAVIAHFFAGILCGSHHPEASGVKKQRNVD